MSRGSSVAGAMRCDGNSKPYSSLMSAFSAKDREQTMEMLLSRERVLSLLYSKVGRAVGHGVICDGHCVCGSSPWRAVITSVATTTSDKRCDKGDTLLDYALSFSLLT